LKKSRFSEDSFAQSLGPLNLRAVFDGDAAPPLPLRRCDNRDAIHFSS